ncbi:MAG: hypothetical protein LBD10_14740 [Desulfobulbus sp.]|uniref:hypothetical protein n=1 Tax=Desulfobulbus sp. TaxID=895 RepID=UPI002844B25A|nr:hypothetical protein [Desulfobulbus sp.]MDR2551445.1 hypothetical protein [Desulfobulbus sp.]
MGKQLEIFKSGKHTALGGQVLEFSEADLQATVAAYDPDKHEAPLVVGHPGIDAPAYGWVKALGFSDSVMTAEPDQVDPAFAEIVNAGRFKRISASFYLPDASNNPVPGVYYLRHVGFLGAQPPAVKGLKSASFAAAEEGVVEFGDWNVDAAQTEAAHTNVKPEPMPAEAEGAQTQEDKEMFTPEQLAAKEAALREKEAAFAEREVKLKQQEQAALHRAHLDFADGLVKAGKLLPAQKEQAVAMLDFASGHDSGQVVEFGEGEARQSLSMGEAFKSFLSAQPEIVKFGEFAKGEAPPADQTAEMIAQKAVEFQESESQSGRVISMAEAVNHVTKGGK